MKMQATTLKVLFIMLFFCWSQLAYALAPIPPIGRVVDTTQILNPQQKAHLADVLQQFESGKGSQIVVLIVNSTDPETIEQYSIRVAQAWKLGRKKIDDGALLVVAMQDRTMRIEVGYGLEGALNDAICKRIISEIITPSFKQGQYYEGINNGVGQIIKTIKGEPLPAPKHHSTTHGMNIEVNGDSFPWIIFLAVTTSMLLRSIFGNTLEKKLVVASFVSILITYGIWLLTISLFTALGAGVLAFIFSMLDPSQGGRGGWGGGGGSDGGFGGGSGGGGFSGGGGSFGGGGSSGRW